MKALYVVSKTRKLSKRKESKIVVKSNDNAILHHNTIKLIGKHKFDQWLQAALSDKMQIPDLLGNDRAIVAEQTLDHWICAEARSKFPHLYPRIDVEAERMKSVLNALQYVEFTTPGDLNELAKEIVKAKDNSITYPLHQNFFIEPSMKELEYIRNEFNAQKIETSCPEYYAYIVARDAVDKIRASRATVFDLKKLTTEIPACTLSYHDVHFLKIAISLLPNGKAQSLATFYLERIERSKKERVSSEDKYLSKNTLEALNCERFLLWLTTTFQRKYDVNNKEHAELLHSLYHYRNSVYHAEYLVHSNPYVIHHKTGEMALIAKKVTEVLKVLYPSDYQFQIKALNDFAHTTVSTEDKRYMCSFPREMLNIDYRNKLRLLSEELRHQINMYDYSYSKFSQLKTTYWTLHRLTDMINDYILSNRPRSGIDEVSYEAARAFDGAHNALVQQHAIEKYRSDLKRLSEQLQSQIDSIDFAYNGFCKIKDTYKALWLLMNEISPRMLDDKFKTNLSATAHDLERRIGSIEFSYNGCCQLKSAYYDFELMALCNELDSALVNSNIVKVAYGVQSSVVKPILFEYDAQEKKAFTESLGGLNAKSSIIEIALETKDALGSEVKVFTRACA